MITYSNKQSVKLTEKFDMDIENYAFYKSDDLKKCIDYTNVDNYLNVVDANKRLKQKNIVTCEKYDIISDDFNKTAAYKMLLNFGYIREI